MVTLGRMKTRPDFLRVAGTQQKFVTRTLVLQYRFNASLNTENKTNVGFTVTKKVGNAVVRNRVKRRLREAIRDSFSKESLPGYELVVIGRYTAYECPFETILEDSRYALRKLRKQQESSVHA